MQQFSLPQPPKIIKKEGNLAVIEINSLYPGYGITLGNALRRVLLSSVPGAAVSAVKIAGVEHEFSTLPGVMEDVIHILLNLKQIRFKLFKNEPAVIKLSVKGEKKVTAADFEPSADVDIVNPAAYITTLTDKKATLEIEAEVSPGLGYEPSERRRKDKLAVGSIALDALYSPVRKVNFKAENMRVGDRTDFNRLIIELETDGSIAPELAFRQGVEILDQHVRILGGIEITEAPSAKMRKPRQVKRTKSKANETS